MSVVRFAKVVSSLPSTLVPDTVYFVRTGEGFDLRVTDGTGAIAHELNATGGGGGDLDLDITPAPSETTDRLLVRRGGSAPFDLGLLSDLTPEQLGALAAEIAEARGDRSVLTQRIGTISNFASPNAGGVVVGQYCDNAFHATNSTNTSLFTDRVTMAPFYTSQRLRVDEIGVRVATASAGALGKCFIYGSGKEGWPDDLLFEASGDLNFSSTGYKSHPLDFTFDAGRQYWLGLRSNIGGGAVSGVAPTSSVNLGLSSGGGTTYRKCLQRTIAYATALPDPWGFDVSEASVAIAVSIRMRVAAL